jgi:hypothetical protein
LGIGILDPRISPDLKKQNMLTQKFSKTFDIGDGREITIETGRLARQADGAVTVRMGNSFY